MSRWVYTLFCGFMISSVCSAGEVVVDPFSMDRLFQANIELRLKVNAFLHFQQRRFNAKLEKERLVENKSFYTDSSNVRQDRGFAFNHTRDDN